MTPLPTFENDGPEIVFGLVGAIGTPLDEVEQALEDSLREVGYSYDVIRVIELLHEIDRWKDLPHANEEERYRRHIDAGREFCEHVGLEDALARLAIGRIKKLRSDGSGAGTSPRSRHAYILRSLKRPAEVALLREVYDAGFILIAASSPREVRIQHLADKFARSQHGFDSSRHRPEAEQLVSIDEREGAAFGQNVRDTFQEADVFINASEREDIRRNMKRFIELLFAFPFHTPTRDEYCMFHAQGAALRSADLSRQVGAVIATAEGDIIAVGTNEVPKAGGGLYWTDDNPDHRDFTRGQDGSFHLRRRTLADALQRLAKIGWLQDERANQDIDSLLAEALKDPIMRDARIMDALEYGRVVHAEMAAITDAARRGVAIKGCSLYTSTFPCHECARHIIAAGIQRVIYVQAYAKSLVRELFPESIAVDHAGDCSPLISFKPFVGVAPRQYMQLFSMRARKDPMGGLIDWRRRSIAPRLRVSSEFYMPSEVGTINELITNMDNTGLAPA